MHIQRSDEIRKASVVSKIYKSFFNFFNAGLELSVPMSKYVHIWLLGLREAAVPKIGEFFILQRRLMLGCLGVGIFMVHPRCVPVIRQFTSKSMAVQISESTQTTAVSHATAADL